MDQKTKDFVIIALGVVGLLLLVKFIFKDWGSAFVTAFVFILGYIIGRKNTN